MNIRKINRKKQTDIFITDSQGIRRRVTVIYDDLKNTKKPPGWMQEILFSRDCNKEKAG